MTKKEKDKLALSHAKYIAKVKEAGKPIAIWSCPHCTCANETLQPLPNDVGTDGKWHSARVCLNCFEVSMVLVYPFGETEAFIGDEQPTNLPGGYNSVKHDTSTGYCEDFEPFCYYLLRTNGRLVTKQNIANPMSFEMDSTVQRWWRVDPANRLDTYRLYFSAILAGADPVLMAWHREQWELTDEDAEIYLAQCNLKFFLDEGKFAVHHRDKTNPDEDPFGYGDSLADAILGYYREVGGVSVN